MLISSSYHKDFDKLLKKLELSYPKEVFNIEGISSTELDSVKFHNNFYGESKGSYTIDPNANIAEKNSAVYSMESEKPRKKLDSLYMLWDKLKDLYSKDVADSIIEYEICGWIYIHDLHGISSGFPYCFNYSTYDIASMGLSMVNKIECKPPKHLLAFKSQLEQFVAIASNNTLGATGLADMLVVMSYYVKNILENLKDDSFYFRSEIDVWNYVRALITSFIYTVNQPYRCGIQSPFTNVSLYDKYFLENMKEDYIFSDGSTIDIETVQKIMKIYVEVMNEEMKRTPITFPVTTACFSVDEERNIKDEEFLDFIAEANKDYGFINIYGGKEKTLSSCCRLRSDGDNEYFNSFGAGSSKIGSLGVCSINFPRLAICYKGHISKFLERLRYFVDICGKVNNAKREIIKEKQRALPLYEQGFMDVQRQYSTAGVNGFYECIEILGGNIIKEEGMKLALKIVDTLNDENNKLQKLYNSPHNCEQVPGETMSIKIAKKDRILGFQNKYDFYSNQFIPLVNNASMLDRIRVQGELDKHFSGGSILHLNVGERIENKKDMKDLIRVTIKNGVIQHAINYNIQRCANGHLTVGKGKVCNCGAPITDEFTRVVGFFTNTKDWHIVRQEKDYPNRKFYGGSEI